MKRIIVSVALLAVGYGVNAQIKSNQPIKSDINGSNAFLDGSTSFSIKSNDNKTGKGLVFPDTDLTSFEFDLSLADGQTFPTWFNGMVVYNIGTGKTGANANTQGIQVDVTPGFYYFSNPTGGDSNSVATGKWVRIGGDDTNTSEWVYDPVTKRINLKRSGNNPFKNLVYYTEKGSYRNIDDPIAPIKYFDSKNVQEIDEVTPLTEDYIFSKNYNRVLGSNIEIPNSVQADVWGNLQATANGNTTYLNEVPAKASHLTSFNNYTYVPSTLSSLKKIKSLSGLGSYLGYHAPVKITELVGSTSSALVGANAVADETVGNRSYVYNYSSQNNKRLFGNSIFTYLRGTGKVSNAIGNRIQVAFQNGSTSEVDRITGNYILMRSWQNSNPTIKTSIGIDISSFINNVNEDAKIPNIANHIGIQVGDIEGGTDSNFAIKTNKGAVQFGDKLIVNKAGDGEEIFRLATERPWYFMQKDTGATAELHFKSVHDRKRFRISNVNDESVATFYVTNTATKDEQRVNFVTNGGRVGIGTETPSEKLEVAGKVKATAFMGTNGATIFPDYVFQKYYTGTSSIKADYNFKSLSQVEDFVKANGHLPGYKSAETIKAQGYVDLMETQLTNVEKIEELYLHSIEQDKALKAKESKIQELEAKNTALESRLERLEKLIQ